MRSPLRAQTEAGSRRFRRYKGEDPRTVEVLAALVDSASQTTPLSCRFPADVQHSSPPDPRPRSLPRRLLPRRGATVSTARRAARLAPAARAPPRPPRPGRDRPAQTAGAAAPGSSCSPAHRRAEPALIGQVARRRPISTRDSRPAPGGEGPRRACSSGEVFRGAAGPALLRPQRREGAGWNTPNSSRPPPGLPSGAWRERVLPPENPLSLAVSAWQGRERPARGRGAEARCVLGKGQGEIGDNGWDRG